MLLRCWIFQIGIFMSATNASGSLSASRANIILVLSLGTCPVHADPIGNVFSCLFKTHVDLRVKSIFKSNIKRPITSLWTRGAAFPSLSISKHALISFVSFHAVLRQKLSLFFASILCACWIEVGILMSCLWAAFLSLEVDVDIIMFVLRKMQGAHHAKTGSLHMSLALANSETSAGFYSFKSLRSDHVKHLSLHST